MKITHRQRSKHKTTTTDYLVHSWLTILKNRRKNIRITVYVLYAFTLNTQSVALLFRLSRCSISTKRFFFSLSYCSVVFLPLSTANTRQNAYLFLRNKQLCSSLSLYKHKCALICYFLFFPLFLFSVIYVHLTPFQHRVHTKWFLFNKYIAIHLLFLLIFKDGFSDVVYMIIIVVWNGRAEPFSWNKQTNKNHLQWNSIAKLNWNEKLV